MQLLSKYKGFFFITDITRFNRKCPFPFWNEPYTVNYGQEKETGTLFFKRK